MGKPEDTFHAQHYVRHNARRLEHLASLGLPLHDRTVLEVGAGIGDHTSFYVDRGCRVIATEGRAENLATLQYRYHDNPNVTCVWVDMDTPPWRADEPDQVESCQIVHCYGLLYHLSKPAPAITWMAEHCTEMLLLETCVSMGDEVALRRVAESAADPSQALRGEGVRPTRRWVFEELKKNFPHVYIPRTQPNHPEFPLDWSAPRAGDVLSRAVFVATREALPDAVASGAYTRSLLALQQRAG